MLKITRPKPTPPSQKPASKKRLQLKFKFNLRNLLSWLLIAVLIGLLLSSFLGPLPAETKPLSEVLSDIKAEKVAKVEVEGEELKVTYKDQEAVFQSRKEPNETFVEVLERSGINPGQVDFEVKDQSVAKAWGNILELLLPVVLTGLIFLFIFRQMRGAQDSIFSFGRSKAKLFAKGKQNIKFADVGGVDEAKKELEEVVDFLKHPRKYRRLGARTPKGVLLVGLSGTGKTLLARAVAGEAGVPYFSMAGSEFMEMLVGVGASRVRDLFNTAKKASPAIIFIDEIDAIGRMRGLGVAGGHDEREQTLNQILVEMDGFTPNDNVIVLAASVTGDTPIAIKEDGKVRLVSIGAFVDQYYESDQEKGEVAVHGIQCLGFEKKQYQGNLHRSRLYFAHSAFKSIHSVFRHRVKEIYEIEYLGGKIRATGNHSVFVRTPHGLKTKAVSELAAGDLLVDLPLKVNRTTAARREIRAHRFEQSWSLSLPIHDQDIEEQWQGKYQYALLASAGGLSQARIGQELGLTQTTVGNWLRGKHQPRAISRLLSKNSHGLPDTIKVTSDFCRLLGYYVAEGYSRWELDFCFNIDEKKTILDVVELMDRYFGIAPKVRHITPNAINLVYSCAPVAKLFARLCGKGAHHKHLPNFLFEAPYPYFREFVRGWWAGDGHKDKRGRGEITTVSRQLATEANWLARMHGLKTYIGGFTAKAGRFINKGKPLKAVRAWRLGWGRGADPFMENPQQANHAARRAIVQKITKKSYDGFVYDLCGVDNEAFFGGRSPILLHNTNRGDLLDPALMRPGRFDRRVTLDLPDLEGRERIIKIHARGKPFNREVSWTKIARRTVGFSGADLENMLNEAAIQAARNNKSAIDAADLEEAATRVKLGPEKKRLQSKTERLMTAYHEAGHAVVAHLLPTMDPVHRVSIVSRGLALGYTLIPPEKDRYQETRTELLEQAASLLGGRAAEEIIFHELTGGAASDIDKVTRLARKMVMDYGMSELGPIYLGPQMESTDWGKAYYQPTELSEKLKAQVDREVKRIVDSAYQTALKLLKQETKGLDIIAKELVKQETLEGEEFEKLMGVKKARLTNETEPTQQQ